MRACRGRKHPSVSVWPIACAWAIGFVAAANAAPTASPDIVSTTTLRVCAPPDNMPFSNRNQQGFENRIAELIAEKLGRKLTYFWFPQATGFIRRTLDAHQCDVIIGYAQGHERVLNTNHYYVSSYVLVSRNGSIASTVTSLSDPRLKGLTLGVVAGSPPATLLTRYGLIEKARPYNLVVDRRFESPGKDMVDDIVSKEIDAGILWGPIGGYYAHKAGKLTVTALVNEPEKDAPRMYYRITMGVRPGDTQWKRRLNSIIRRNQEQINAILQQYHVPLLDTYGQPQ